MDQEMISNSKRKSPESNICKQIPPTPPTPDCLVLEGWVLTQQKISRRRKSPFCMVGFNLPLTPFPSPPLPSILSYYFGQPRPFTRGPCGTASVREAFTNVAAIVVTQFKNFTPFAGMVEVG